MVLCSFAKNPWIECNLIEAKQRGIPIVRRFSGGGTVYHVFARYLKAFSRFQDLGCAIYSVIMPRAVFSRSTYTDMVIDALRPVVETLDLKLHRSPRNDIWIKDAKVSGSAYKVVRDRALHHGTLLCQTDLAVLRGLLAGPTLGLHLITDPAGQTHTVTAVTSHPAPTANLRTSDGSPIDQTLWARLLLDQFIRHHGATAADLALEIFTDEMVNDEILDIQSQLQDQQRWIYGKTPTFFIKVKDAWARIINGLYIDQSNDPSLIGQSVLENLHDLR